MSACSKCGVEMGHASGLGSPCVTCRIESGDWDPAPADAFRATSPGLCPDPIPDDIRDELTTLRARVKELEAEINSRKSRLTTMADAIKGSAGFLRQWKGYINKGREDPYEGSEEEFESEANALEGIAI